MVVHLAGDLLYAVEFSGGFAVLTNVKPWPTRKPHFLYVYWK